jgi:hypothetical protein
MHGLGDAVSLLGPLPAETIVRVYCRRQRLDHRFFSSSTGLETTEDPRLPPLSSEWERFEREWTPDDPEPCTWFRNTVTGEEINSDPRMLPEALKARGVSLRTFQLL